MGGTSSKPDETSNTNPGTKSISTFMETLEANTHVIQEYVLRTIANVCYETVSEKLNLGIFFYGLNWSQIEKHGGKITDLAQGKAGDVKLLRLGGKEYVVKQIKYLQNIYTRKQTLGLATACFDGQDMDVQLFGADYFLNEYLVGAIVKSTLESKGLGFLGPEYHAAFVERNRGNIIMQKSAGDLGKIKDLDSKKVVSIIMQVCRGLDCLKEKIFFSHNDLKLENVLFSKHEHCPPNWPQEIPWTGIVIKFTDFEKSSCVLGSREEHNLPLFIFSPGYGRILPQSAFVKKRVDGIDGFIVSFKSFHKTQTFLNSRHSGDIWYKSFDFYIFLCTILLNKAYAKVIDGDKPLTRALCQSFMTPDQYNKRIKRKRKDSKDQSISIQQAIDAINGLSLRCDGISQTYEALKEYNISKSI